jgi:hypothetical protein
MTAPKKMNKRIKARWVKALRSGRYKQGRNMLRTDDGKFCCLGVLCDLHSKSTGTAWGTDGRYFGNSATLPLPVMEWAGLDLAPELTIGGSTLFASEHNDEGSWRFSTIAKAIEAQL